ncbi:hypothetical protein DUNSADRAFT_7435 [Dunaliella salina]|uniref:Encoded protein n=1 Tax=Dunaliella salina TaxID=3046 RepID=A0ABQ7GLF9_DUNSA|nr:hypothetical protein DUNSADRAFT_7435 [Dunaliella salina]|eukprot:KAF5835447.1 hypothetical protein DUNSADRAFT_7435 [Dunaliella salina]
MLSGASPRILACSVFAFMSMCRQPDASSHRNPCTGVHPSAQAFSPMHSE